MLGFRVFFILLLIFIHASAYAQPCENTKQLIINVLDCWQSSDQFIPGHILRNEMEKYLPSKIKRQLAACSADQIHKTLLADFLTPPLLNKGQVENLLKIHKICRLQAKNISVFTDARLDEIQGLPQAKLNSLVQDFPANTSKIDNTYKGTPFDFKTYLLTQLSKKHAINNDKYAFTSPAILWSEGLNDGTEVVFELSSRGHDAYPYLVTAGQDQIIDLLSNLHFTRWEVEFLKAEIGKDFSVHPEFWNWLLNWRFKGEIRGVRVGTIVFPNEPIIQVITDPVSALIVESLINPWISSMTNLMTTATRLMVAKGDIKVITEAGTRRVVTGDLSAYTGLLAGATGTSNTLMAYLLGSKAYGTMQHAFIGMFESEAESYETFLRRSKAPNLVLPDTYHLPDGIRTAVRAGGNHVATIRQDSNMISASTDKPLTTIETIAEIQKIWKSLGREQMPGIVTNDLTEKSLHELAQAQANVSTVSLGGAFAAPSRASHGNMVYKLIEVRNRGHKRFPVKVANKEKSTWPGQKVVYRNFKDGRMTHDTVEYIDESNDKQELQSNRRPLLTILFNKNGRVEPRALPSTTTGFIQEQLAQMPTALLDPNATQSSLRALDKTYPVHFSELLKEIKSSAIANVTPKTEHRILVVPGSFDPIVEQTHITAVKRAIELFKDQSNPSGFNEVIFVPTGPMPVHGKIHHLTPETRINLAKNKTKQLGSKVTIWTSESQTFGARTIDTLTAIQSHYPSNAVVTVALGEDNFWEIASNSHSWYKADTLLLNFNFVVFERPEGSFNPKTITQYKAETTKRLLALGFTQHLNGFTGPNGTKIEFFNAHIPNIPATIVRNFYSQQAIFGMFHLTDPQWTFLKRSAIPTSSQNVDGTLAVNGTEKTLKNIIAATQATLDNGSFKISMSNDAHFDVERRDPTQNGEFHPPYNFPEHGMKNKSGPQGDQIIEELQTLIPENMQVLIPAHKVTLNEAGNEQLTLDDFQLSTVQSSIKDPKKMLRFEKNGVGSYSVFVNPHYEKYLESIDPYKILPHFHLAWCMDFCTYSAVKGELARGYQNVFILLDATAGVFPKLTAMKIRELIEDGATFITTAEYLKFLHHNKQGSSWAKALNDLTELKKFSPTQKNLIKTLSGEQYTELLPGETEQPGQCTVFLE